MTHFAQSYSNAESSSFARVVGAWKRPAAREMHRIDPGR